MSRISEKEVNWNNQKRKEHFGLIAKKIKGKEELRKDGYICYDLDDIVTHNL